MEEEMIISIVSEDKIQASWSLSPVKKDFVYEYFGKKFLSFQKALCLYDVTNLIFNGNNAYEVHEFFMREEQHNWTIKGLKPNRNYCLEFGIKLTEHEFFPLIRSHCVQTSGYSGEQKDKKSVKAERVFPEESPSPIWTQHVSTYTYYDKIPRIGARS
jgi:uncharacterized protein